MALRLVKSSARKSKAGSLMRSAAFIEFIKRLARAQAREDAREFIRRSAELKRQASEVGARRRRRLQDMPDAEES